MKNDCTEWDFAAVAAILVVSMVFTIAMALSGAPASSKAEASTTPASENAEWGP
ncbi:MAG TPA: hypothetical protein VIX18_09170 [Nitrospirota bacterium]